MLVSAATAKQQIFSEAAPGVGNGLSKPISPPHDGMG
jgi:hypothetical protein